VCCSENSEYSPDIILTKILHPYAKANTILKYVDMPEVTNINSMQYIFAQCHMLDKIDFRTKNDIETAIDFDYAFYGFWDLKRADLGKFKELKDF